MRFDFRLIPNEKIAELISNIYLEQGKQFEKEAIYAIAKAGEGSIRDALSIADTALSYGRGMLTYNDVMDILGSSNSELLIKLISAILNSNTGEVLSIIDELSSLGKSMGMITKDVTSVVRDLLVVKTCGNAKEILAMPENMFSLYKNLVVNFNESRLVRILQVFSEAENALKYTNHPRVVFETAAVKATKPDADYDIEALLARIKDLEDKLKDGVFIAPQIKTVEVSDTPTKSDIKIEAVHDIAQNNTQDEPVNKLSFQSISLEDLKGKLLVNLRKIGSEMLWNIVQSLVIETNADTLIITTSNSCDQELLDRAPSRARIEEALTEFMPFKLQIKLSSEEKSLDAVDEAAERIKRIFGDDIVIIK
jgi:DNA polymerase-3 subunit gamma/tau